MESVTSAHISKTLHDRWRDFNRSRKHALKTRDIDSIHDLRIASRRMRAAIRLFEPFSDRKQAGYIAGNLRKITRKLGNVRNLDEAILFFGAATDQDEFADLIARLRQMRNREMDKTVRSLAHFPVEPFGEKLRLLGSAIKRTCSKKGKGSILPAYLQGVSLARFHEISGLFAPALLPENVSARHALRIAIKKWRYTLEIVAFLLGRDYSVLLGQLKEYQSLLGRMNDMAEFALLCDSPEIQPSLRTRAAFLLDAHSRQLFDHFLELAGTRPLHCPCVPEGGNH